ncbi:MAG: cysteine desulfurase [Actinomycetales bacterium]|nr:cysteine desulfurase [Actinomycetales bacterium]
MLYLDHAATTPVKPEVLKAAWPYLTEEFGNPSSVHETGLRAKAALDWARETCAEFLGVYPHEIAFTSGGTESNNLAILGIALGSPRGRHIVSARTEHSSVLACLDYLERSHGFEISYLEVDGEGRVSPTALRSALRPGTTLVSLMLANNETGLIHPVAQLAEVAAEFEVPFHTDAVQAPGWLDLKVPELGVQALSLSGHKFGAPKGSGLVYLSSALTVEPLIHGGGQEQGLRSGTQNLAWTVALAVALQLAEEPGTAQAKTGAVSAAFIDGVMTEFPNAHLTGPSPESGERHPAIASFTFEGINGETLLLELENAGVQCSSGSACSAGSTEPSHVLTALGIAPDTCRTAVRFSFGHDATADDSARALAALRTALARLG